MKRGSGILLLCLFFLTTLEAAPDRGPSELSDIPLYATISLAGPALANTFQFVSLAIPQFKSIAPWIANPLQLINHIPLYWLDPGIAWRYTVAGVALPGVGISLMLTSQPDDDARIQLASLALGVYQHVTEFSSYAVYREAREMVDESYHGDGFLEVLSGIYTPRVLAQPAVWIPVIAGPAILVPYLYFLEKPVARQSEPEDEAAQVADTLFAAAVNIVAMTFVGLGEESVFRGVAYEEIKRGSDGATAKIVDSVVFPLIHLPGDIAAGFTPLTIAFQFLWRVGMTFAFDLAYDAGGLPWSAAAHTWSDIILILARIAIYGA